MVRKSAEPVDGYCRDCVHATDFHSKSIKGEMILCKCKFFEFSRLLNWDTCNNFKKKHGKA